MRLRGQGQLPLPFTLHLGITPRPARIDDAAHRPRAVQPPRRAQLLAPAWVPEHPPTVKGGSASDCNTRSTQPGSAGDGSRQGRRRGPGTPVEANRSAAPRTRWSKLANAPDASGPPRRFRVTLPFTRSTSVSWIWSSTGTTGARTTSCGYRIPGLHDRSTGGALKSRRRSSGVDVLLAVPRPRHAVTGAGSRPCPSPPSWHHAAARS